MALFRWQRLDADDIASAEIQRVLKNMDQRDRRQARKVRAYLIVGVLLMAGAGLSIWWLVR